MKNYQTIIFDFDGTLFDSAKGIKNAVKYAVQDEPNASYTDEILETFIGPPIHYSFEKHFGFDKEKAKEIVIIFREYYAKQGYQETELYDGIREMLLQLIEQGKTLAIATAKPTVYAKKILQNFGMTDLFSSIQGSESKGELFPKTRIIGTVLEELEIVDTENAIMIGDTIYDIKGAQDHHLETIAVTYGYGKVKDLIDAKATYFVNNVEELQTLISK